MCSQTCSCTKKCKTEKPLLDQIGALTRTAQQFEHKAASLRLLARRLQERVNRGER